jgi:hypothetical protein
MTNRVATLYAVLEHRHGRGVAQHFRTARRRRGLVQQEVEQGATT